jgi:hypothetical protein
MLDGKLRASGILTLANEDSQFQLEPCKNSDDEGCYLWKKINTNTK